MPSPLILVTSDYTSYREALTYAIGTLRPGYVVREVLPDEMDTAVRAERPWLVICSTVIHAIEEVSPAWILLPINGDQAAQVSVQGQRRTLPVPPVADLLTMIDELWTVVAPLPQR